MIESDSLDQNQQFWPMVIGGPLANSDVFFSIKTVYILLLHQKYKPTAY